MAIAFNGFNETLATFQADGTLTAGAPVKASANRTVSGCAANNVFLGVCKEQTGPYAGVQLTGYARLPYSGAAPAVGYTQLAADGSGGVKTVSSGGRFYDVLEVDTAGGTVGLLL